MIRAVVGSNATSIDVLKVAFTVVAGVGGAVALVVAYRRQNLSPPVLSLKRSLNYAEDAKSTCFGAQRFVRRSRERLLRSRRGGHAKKSGYKCRWQ